MTRLCPESQLSPEQLEAGVRLLADEWGVVSRHVAEELVEELIAVILLAAEKGAPLS
jgi:predicted peroxiredoxin